MASESIRDAAALTTALRLVVSALSGAGITGDVDGEIKKNKIVVTATGDAPAAQIREALAFALNAPHLDPVTITISGRCAATVTFPLD